MPCQIRKDEIKNYRLLKATKNKFVCPICKKPMAKTRIVLDHCHKTGLLRDAICNACNRAEGKIGKTLEHYTMRKMMPKGHPIWDNPAKWLRNLADYLVKHQEKPSNKIHPTFDLKTGKQKKNG